MSSFQSPTEFSADDGIRVDTPEQIALEFPLAGLGSRFMALAVDTLIQFLLYLGVIFAMAALARYARFLPSELAWLPTSWMPALVIAFSFCVYWGYFAVFEFFWKGRTPGKRVTGIRVMKDSGRALNVYEVIGRNLLRAVDWLPFMYVVGIVTMALSRQNQRLGDHLVGSIVVHDKRAEALPPDWNSPQQASSGEPALAQITPEELVLIETYLQRRDTLDYAVRDNTAHRIASRITAKTGVQRPAGQSLDDFLESIAKQVRDTVRFR